MSDDEEDGTTRFYAGIADHYALKGGGAPNPLLPPFLARLRPGSRILSLAAGQTAWLGRSVPLALSGAVRPLFTIKAAQFVPFR